MASIRNITARQIFDSRGVPTVEVTVELNTGETATSSTPSGSVAHEFEAQELRDGDSSEYFGLGVKKAVENVNTIIRDELIGKDPLYQTQIDQILVNADGTTNKSKLGSNAILATSQAVMKAAAASLRLPLFVYIKEKYQLIQSYRVPTPIFNLINGGSHGAGTLDFQEFQLVPASHLGYSQALQIGVEMFMAIDKILQQKGALRTVGVQGGYSPNLATNTDALEIFSEAIKLTRYALAKDAFLGLDVTPRAFHRNGKYTIKDRPQPMKGKELVQFYKDLHHQYRVFSFEDPFVPDSWSDWKYMTAEMGSTAMIVADNLVSTNKTLLMKAIQENACNAVVIKPNRIGTVTEAIELTHLARQNGWHTIMAHRSGETTDDFLADLAVGIGTEYVKFGAPSRGERIVKYNRLLRIEEILLLSRKSTTTQTGNQNAQETQTMNMNDNGATTNPLGGSNDISSISGSPSAPAPAPAQPAQPAQTPAAQQPAPPQTAATPVPPQPATPTAPAPAQTSANPAPKQPVGANQSGTPSQYFPANEAAATPAQPAAAPAQPPVNTTPPSTTQDVNSQLTGSPAPRQPAAAQAPETPAQPAPSVTPVMSQPASNEQTPAEAENLQDSINELANMAAQPGATPPPAPPTPTQSQPPQDIPATAAPQANTPAGPAGLVPPVPPASQDQG